MDSEFHPLPSFDFRPSTWNIDRVVLFGEAASADIFLQKVFPYFTNCIVASADRAFPLREDLKHAVFSSLESDPRIRVAVCGLYALQKVKLLTERVIVLDDLLMQDFKKYPTESELGFGFSPQKIAFFIESFFSQWDKMARVGNTSFAYRHFSEYSKPDEDWKRDLVAPASANAHVP